MIVYGPVPSRRLGQSVGINNIPLKYCSYSCIYCQIGRTDKMQLSRREFYRPEVIFNEAEDKIKRLQSEEVGVDYISFVPDGEPTLDKNLGMEIDLLKKLGIKIAVITNASLLWMDEVKEDLMKADWISVKIDAAKEDLWRKINRPHGLLELNRIIAGIKEFSQQYKGVLFTETMLVEGINDSEDNIMAIGRHLADIRPQKACLLVPVRPPAEVNIKRPQDSMLAKSARILHDLSGAEIECITGDEKDDGFYFSEDIVSDLLSIISVHPVREDIVDDLLKNRNLDKSIIEELVKQNRIRAYIYEGKKYYRLST